MKFTKTFTIIALLCINIVIIGCAAKPYPIVNTVSPTQLITTGSWEMVSIEDTPVEEYFVPLKADYVDTETEITQNDFIFFPSGIWNWTLELKITARLKDGSGLAYLPEVTMAARGHFRRADMELELVLETLKAQLKPPDFWTSAGITEDGFADAVTSGRLFEKIEKWNVNLSGDTLTLTSTDGKTTQVLRRKR